MSKRSRPRIAQAAAVVVGSLLAQVVWGQIPSFSGAEGPGANATGGRGGDVYHVTRLDFDKDGLIPGSLKYGINNAPSAGRTIVFDVGGTIFQNGGGANWWFRSSKDNITIAGQTAPGAGITIAGVGSKFTGNNIVLRNLTVRTNKDPVNPTNFTYDAFSLQTTNSIVDHVTATWATDEGVSITDAGHTSTVQYAMIGENLGYNGHAFGSIINSDVNDANYSFHHNLYTHLQGRIPAIGAENGTGPIINFSNNVIYNWQQTKAGYSATGQKTRSNWIGNYYITGPNRGNLTFSGGDDAASVGFTRIFVQDKNTPAANKSDWNRDGVLNGNTYNATDTFNGSNKYYSGSQTFVSTPFTITGVAEPDTADLAYQRVTSYVGANWQNRNPIDARILNTVATQTGGIITDLTSGTQATEWATVMSQQASGGVAPFNRPANFDTDQDGMPNDWEVIHLLDPNVQNHNGDFDTDGYTNLEEYINELAEWPAPKPITFNAATNNRYARITNWDIKWQPSKYDTAVINSGTVVVDAVGQHAGTLQINNTATLSVTSGWITAGTVTGAGSANVTGGEMITGSIRVNDLVISGTGLAVVMSNGTSTATSKITNLAITDNGQLDLTNNTLVVTGTALSDVTNLIASGRNGGTWDGIGIATSLPDAQTGYTSIGVATASESLGIGLGATTVWSGQTVTGDDALVMYTYGGDANLSGNVDVDDYGQIDFNASTGGLLTGWFNGDFDYSGSVDVDDYGIIDFVVNIQGPPFPTASPAMFSAVPEPASLTTGLLLGASALKRRRRR